MAVLSLGQNGQVTIPVQYRKQHRLGRGGKMVAIEVGDALVMAPHDPFLESISTRLEEAMHSSRVSLEELKQSAVAARKEIVRKRYGK